MIGVDEARARILATAPPPATEIVTIGEAAGRTLTAPIVARRTQPPAAMSAMDGYAVRAADLPEAGVPLKVVGVSPAGQPFDGAVGPGETVRIFTGGEMPAGADAVMLQEDAEVDGDTVSFTEPARPNRHVRGAGIDFVAGESTIPAGAVMTPRHLALAAGMNVVWARVARRPKVAILATGDEIRLPGDPLGPGQIVGSSGIGVAAYVAECGGDPTVLDIAGDSHAALVDAARQARGADILVTLGGASVGDHDLVQEALASQGLNVDFWRIAMRPGKPLMFGAMGEQLVMGLPGNPVSTMVCALLYLGPLLARMLGRAETGPRTVSARATEAMPANDRRQDFIRARLERADGGGLTATPFPVQDSSMMSVFAAANGLIVRLPHAPALKVGDQIEALPLDPQ